MVHLQREENRRCSRQPIIAALDLGADNGGIVVDMSEGGLRTFDSYLLLGPHKAFATSANYFGFSTAQMTVDEARQKALENCNRNAQKKEACVVVSVDNAEVRK